MAMQVFSARVRAGAIVPEDGVTLPEGTVVTVIAREDEASFELTEAEEAELAESIAGADRGEVVTAAEVLRRLSR